MRTDRQPERRADDCAQHEAHRDAIKRRTYVVQEGWRLDQRDQGGQHAFGAGQDEGRHARRTEPPEREDSAQQQAALQDQREPGGQGARHACTT